MRGPTPARWPLQSFPAQGVGVQGVVDHEADRIDFIFSRGARALEAFTVIAEIESAAPPILSANAQHSVGPGADILGHHLENAWPTDHAAVVARLALKLAEGAGPNGDIRFAV